MRAVEGHGGGALGKHQQPMPRRMAAEVKENIDPRRADGRQQVVVAQLRHIVPVMEPGPQLVRHRIGRGRAGGKGVGFNFRPVQGGPQVGGQVGDRVAAQIR